eukprot:6696577-Alexandrium_andersonii.AAC.1
MPLGTVGSPPSCSVHASSQSARARSPEPLPLMYLPLHFLQSFRAPRAPVVARPRGRAVSVCAVRHGTPGVVRAPPQRGHLTRRRSRRVRTGPSGTACAPPESLPAVRAQKP